MKDSLLFTLLSLLTKEEKHSFEKYLSPKTGGRKTIYSLYKIIIENYNNIENDSSSKEELFNKLFQKKNFTDNVKVNSNLFRQHFSDLTDVLERYLALKFIEDNKFLFNYYFLCSIVKRDIKRIKSYTKVNRLINKKIKEGVQLLNEMQNDENYFYQKHLYMDLFHEFYSYSNLPKAPSHLIEEYNYLYYHTLIVFLRGFTNILCQVQGVNKRSLPLFKEIMGHLAQDNIPDIKLPNGFPLLRFYYLLFNVVDKFIDDKLEIADNYILELHSMMDKYFDIIHETEKSYLYSILTDYYIKVFHSSSSFEEIIEFRKKKNNIDKMFFTGSIVNLPFGGNVFPFILFFNIFKNAIIIEDPWAESFFDNYKNLIEIKYRDETQMLCKAYNAFYKKDYTETFKLLSNKQTKAKYHNFIQEERCLKTMLLFEKEDYNEAADFAMNSKRILIKKHSNYYTKLKPNVKNEYRNFYKTITKTINAIKKRNINGKRKEKLMQYIVNKPTKNREWLIKTLQILN